jgi:hypothetical protein
MDLRSTVARTVQLGRLEVAPTILGGDAVSVFTSMPCGLPI